MSPHNIGECSITELLVYCNARNLFVYYAIDGTFGIFIKYAILLSPTLVDEVSMQHIDEKAALCSALNKV